MTEVKNSQNLNNRIKDYYLGKLSLFDMGIVYLDEKLYSAAASYFLAAARKATTDTDKANCITHCAYSYYMQLEKDSSDWQRDVVEELCRHALVKDRDNFMNLMILISLYDFKKDKRALYYREYALKYCNIPNVYEKTKIYKECIECAKTYNKHENKEFYSEMSRFIEMNIRLIPKDLICILYNYMYNDIGDTYALKRFIEITENDIYALAESPIKNNTVKTYCEITTNQSSMTLSKIFEDAGYNGATISKATLPKWTNIRKNRNLGLNEWSIEYNNYFNNFKKDGIAGILILDDLEDFMNKIGDISFERSGFEYVIVKDAVLEILNNSDFYRNYVNVVVREERTMFKEYSLFKRRK